MERLKGKTAIITGAAGGQGRAACRRFAEEGATVVASDLAAAHKNEIEGLAPGLITYVGADLARLEPIHQLVEVARTTLGGSIDILYNNHGVILGKPFLETTPEDWDRILTVNLKSFFS